MKTRKAAKRNLLSTLIVSGMHQVVRGVGGRDLWVSDPVVLKAGVSDLGLCFDLRGGTLRTPSFSGTVSSFMEWPLC